MSVYKTPPQNSAFSHPPDGSQWGLAGRLLCNGPAASSDPFFVGLGYNPVQGQCTDAPALRSRVSPVHPLNNPNLRLCLPVFDDIWLLLSLVRTAYRLDWGCPITLINQNDQ